MSLEVTRYRHDWAAWLPAALPLLENEQYADALATFPKPPEPELPFLAAPSAPQRRIAFVTSAGAYDTATQAPFFARSPIGDITPRIFPTDLPEERIGFAHGHYEQKHVVADHEVLVPRRSLASAGAVLTPHVLSYMGYTLDWPSFIEATIPQLIAQARADGANCALLVPA